MPSKTPRQRRFMSTCASTSGLRWAKSKGVKCPPKKVAKEFVKADKRKCRNQ